MRILFPLCTHVCDKKSIIQSKSERNCFFCFSHSCSSHCVRAVMVRLGKMLLGGVFTLWILFLINFAFGTNVDVQSDGTIADDSVTASFVNNYNKPIHLFWEGADGSSVKMGVLSRSGSAQLNTFSDHVFFATFDAEATQRVNPQQV